MAIVFDNNLNSMGKFANFDEEKVVILIKRCSSVSALNVGGSVPKKQTKGVTLR